MGPLGSTDGNSTFSNAKLFLMSKSCAFGPQNNDVVPHRTPINPKPTKSPKAGASAIQASKRQSSFDAPVKFHWEHGSTAKFYRRKTKGPRRLCI